MAADRHDHEAVADVVVQVRHRDPLAVAVGWELALDDRIVVVKEVHGETLVVVHADGKRETVEIVREDTDENARELEGSTYEVEIEEEVDE